MGIDEIARGRDQKQKLSDHEIIRSSELFVRTQSRLYLKDPTTWEKNWKVRAIELSTLIAK